MIAWCLKKYISFWIWYLNFVLSIFSSSWFTTEWMSWNKYSENMLRSIEKKILQNIKSIYRGWFVDIGPVVGKCDKIWTISLNPESTNTPLVLLHGFGAGVALWCLNLDSLAVTRPVFAIDLLGFGRSSRPKFSTDALEAERQMVKAIEEWRKEMNLENFVLLGHSMGGFLATSYAISHPHRVKHLILADPWGFPEKPAESSVKIPLWIKVLAFTLQPFNPLWAVRAAGPFGEWLITKARPDILRKYESFVNDGSLIPQYIYQCNSQKPSGESAFHNMSHFYAWAKHPMVRRIPELHKNVPITLIYGSKSWVDNDGSEIVKERKVNFHTRVITGAGHHVYADKPNVFNEHVLHACASADTEFKSPLLAIKASGETESTLQVDKDQPEDSVSDTTDAQKT
ncbi:hydrolase [Oryctes borbonicus]|uniref:1-acylglycerol-3-phosphate O-acyltransferase ABHD5 n=1 Tax=Oryctes borbonicus TaxID=1629725 RepID=A0A0T6BD78_9SCAR|nr:hydrolase [Oryctes borbonicus]